MGSLFLGYCLFGVIMTKLFKHLVISYFVLHFFGCTSEKARIAGVNQSGSTNSLTLSDQAGISNNTPQSSPKSAVKKSARDTLNLDVDPIKSSTIFEKQKNDTGNDSINSISAKNKTTPVTATVDDSLVSSIPTTVDVSAAKNETGATQSSSIATSSSQ